MTVAKIVNLRRMWIKSSKFVRYFWNWSYAPMNIFVLYLAAVLQFIQKFQRRVNVKLDCWYKVMKISCSIGLHVNVEWNVIEHIEIFYVFVLQVVHIMNRLRESIRWLFYNPIKNTYVRTAKNDTTFNEKIWIVFKILSSLRYNWVC